MTPATDTARMTAEEYFAAPGLSNSGMRDLAVSPYRFWHLHLNPERPVIEPTAEQLLGSAVHAAILEPDEFEKRYACQAEVPDGCLRTIEEMRQFLKDKGRTPKGTRKSEVIAQVQDYDPSVPILEIIEREHAEANAGKHIFSAEDWRRIGGMAAALWDEPRVADILGGEGKAEYPIFTMDADTGVTLKGKIDWLAPTLSMDLKSFRVPRGKSVDKAVNDAIFWERYYVQAHVYALLRGWPQNFSGETVLAFVESDPPHEVRLRSLRPKMGGNVNLFWERARIEVRQLIRTYAECKTHFGDAPWKYAQEITVLQDEELPGGLYAA